MTWLWKVPDLKARVAYARRTAPGDVFTQLARLLVNPITILLALVLAPVDYAARQLGRLSVIFVGWGLIFFFFLTLLWFPLWGMLAGSSWLWLNYAWTRPLLLLPGGALSIVLTVFLMLVPDPEKHPKYVTIAQEWPLTWLLWRPTFAYFDEHGINDPDINPYEWERLFGDQTEAEPIAGKYDPQKSR